MRLSLAQGLQHTACGLTGGDPQQNSPPLVVDGRGVVTETKFDLALLLSLYDVTGVAVEREVWETEGRCYTFRGW